MTKKIIVYCNNGVEKMFNHYKIKEDGLIQWNLEKDKECVFVCIEANGDLRHCQYHALMDVLDELTIKHPQAPIEGLNMPFDVAEWYKNISGGDTGIFEKMLGNENKFNPKW